MDEAKLDAPDPDEGLKGVILALVGRSIQILKEENLDFLLL